MPTQVLTLALGTDGVPVTVRDDVDAVFVAVTRDGRPVALALIDRPADGHIDATRALAAAFTRAPDAHAAGPVTAPLPLTIVVCTHERPADLARCLESLAPARAAGHEVIVVDNAPSTDATALVASRYDVRRIVEPSKGLDHARNAGLAAAEHAIVAFVDDDVVVSAGWASAVAAGFDRADVACVTGLVLPLELETEAQEWFEQYSRQRRDLMPRAFSLATLRPSTAGIVGMGANMAFRRDLCAAVGGFDPRLDAGTRTESGGDTDMFARVIDAGYTIAYIPDAFAWHRHRRTPSEVRRCVFGYGVGLYSVLTKRLLERGDFAAVITGARWFVGPVMKAAAARLSGGPSAPWSVVLSETAGALRGPFRLAAETRLVHR